MVAFGSRTLGPVERLIRIGHKGADSLVPGNTVESFIRAVEVGVDMIEMDVLWLPDGKPSLPAGERSPLAVVHDWRAAEKQRPPTLDEVLASFTRPPLDRVRINLDIKLPGREAEMIEAIHRHDLAGRSSISTMEVRSLRAVRELDPGLPRGWTVPRVSFDWTAPWLRPLLLLGAEAVRRRLPGKVKEGVPELGVESVWAWHGAVTEPLVAVTKAAGVDLNVWTVDDPAQVARLAQMGVSGICSNDPRILNGSTPAE